jgi:DNA-binding NtrC family response regulator
VKLLRAIQEGEVEPVGAKKPVKVDVRLVSATNRNLMADVKSGRFREDLFYRLHVFPIAVPALRERLEDIPDLVRHFLARISAEEGKRIRAISAEALKLLSSHRWPGNVRQLENAVFRAVVLAESDTIGVEEFPQVAAQIASPPSSPALPDLLTEAPQQFIDVGPATVPGLSAPMSSATLPLLDGEGEVRPLEDIEADAIRFAIAHYREQMSEVARRLRIGRSTLYRKLEILGLGDNDGANQKERAEAR